MEPGPTDRLFLGRYLDPLTLRARAAFRVVSARRAGDGAACVVVTAGEKADRARVAEAFAEVERAHALFSHPRVPRVVHRGEHAGEPLLELDFPAVADGHDFIELLSTSGLRQPYGPADSFIASLREAIGAANAAVDPRTGGPLCLGRIGLANMLFAADGRWALVGFGRNFPLEREDGTIDPAAAFHQAPELSTGGRPTPEGDYVALILQMRALLPWVDMSGPVGRILRGEIQPSDAELIACLRWTEEHMVGCIPAMRATVDEAVRVAQRVRELQGATRDEPAYEAFVRDLLARAEDQPMRLEGDAAPGERTLTVGPDAAWIAAPDGARHRLGRASRRLLLALVARHEAPSSPLGPWDLLAAGWPGEATVGDSGINRVYVALSRLRALGLRDVIERVDDGYRIAPGTIVRRAS